MSGYELDDENSFEAPRLIEPKLHELKLKGHSFDYKFPMHSITVFRFDQAKTIVL
ncbi:hypothetical protein ACUIJN_09420 [Metabacillus halosaccharovorans]|uniref:hypothetical protein n=1 Tax=Metabacillus halosaccharovorans TaxID=930124 RepID=UPI00203AC2AE|nr:hypothetical protein [Metabacillus halosaccharovorans]MCM3443663.1 hypothetical protein [Metabacillus halosaccharovorans]